MSIGKEAKTSTETPKQQPATRSLGWVIPVLGELRCTAGPVCMWGSAVPRNPRWSLLSKDLGAAPGGRRVSGRRQEMSLGRTEGWEADMGSWDPADKCAEGPC